MLFCNKIIQEIADCLVEMNWQLVTAESCTGGLIASVITDTPGSSRWFDRGFVTYSNLSKQEMLHVPNTVLMNHGAVSEQTAIAMAIGALKNSAAQIALSVTGVAGPGGGSVEKPVGTVCFGWAAQGVIPQSFITRYSGNRCEVRQAACAQALEGILRLLKNIK